VKQVSSTYLTPNALHVLIYHHFSLAPHPRHHAPAVKEARESFIKRGVLHPVEILGSVIRDDSPVRADHRIFKTTELGQKWVEKLCRTTCPEA